MGRYASKHEHTAVVKKLKVDFEVGQLGESTVRLLLFFKCYFKELKKENIVEPLCRKLKAFH